MERFTLKSFGQEEQVVGHFTFEKKVEEVETESKQGQVKRYILKQKVNKRNKHNSHLELERPEEQLRKRSDGTLHLNEERETSSKLKKDIHKGTTTQHNKRERTTLYQVLSALIDQLNEE